MSSEVTFLTKPALQRRWGKPDRTIDRWRDIGRLPAPDTYLGAHPAWREQTILAAEAEWARQGAARIPHQDTDKAHAAAAEKRAQLAEQSARWVKKNAPKEVLKPARKATQSTRRGA